MLFRFIGGTNYIAISKFIHKMYDKSIIPIIDYAKEGAKTPGDVISYNKEVVSLINQISQEHTNRDIGYAIKLSSFSAYNPEDNIDNFIKRVINTQHKNKYIYFDAEYTNLYDEENRIFNKIIQKYQDIDNLHLFKTYQMYKKNSLYYIKRDLDTYDKIGFKLVRGAYYNSEDKELFKDKTDTDVNYNDAVKYLISNTDNKICIATHNKDSIDYALSFNPGYNVSYAQLLGMGDSSTECLLNKNKTVFKYVPYGNVFDIYPYLLRRLYENIDMLKYMK
jgi:proline dehydrogenase